MKAIRLVDVDGPVTRFRKWRTRRAERRAIERIAAFESDAVRAERAAIQDGIKQFHDLVNRAFDRVDVLEARQGAVAEGLRRDIATIRDEMIARISGVPVAVAPQDMRDGFKKLAEDLVALKNRMDGFDSRPQVAPAVVGSPGDFLALQRRIEVLEKAPPAANGSIFDAGALMTRMDALEAALTSPVALPSAGFSVDEAVQVTTRIEVIEKAWNAFQAELPGLRSLVAAVDALNRRLTHEEVELKLVKTAAMEQATLVLEHEDKIVELQKQLEITVPAGVDLTARP